MCTWIRGKIKLLLFTLKISDSSPIYVIFSFLELFQGNKDDHAAEENENETCHEIVEKDEETTEENVLKRRCL